MKRDLRVPHVVPVVYKKTSEYTHGNERLSQQNDKQQPAIQSSIRGRAKPARIVRDERFVAQRCIAREAALQGSRLEHAQ
jgi:hypothetical protein